MIVWNLLWLIKCNWRWYVLWNSSTLATSFEELTHWKRLWCWEGLGAGGEGDDRGWDGWMASPTRWTWVSVNSGRWWWTGRPGVLRFMGSQRVGHDWATDLIWSSPCSSNHENICQDEVSINLKDWLWWAKYPCWSGLNTCYEWKRKLGCVF